jgi:hypothetical protein
MKFGTRVVVVRGETSIAPKGSMGCRRKLKGLLVGAKGYELFVRLTEDDPLDPQFYTGRNKTGTIRRFWHGNVFSDRRYH